MPVHSPSRGDTTRKVAKDEVLGKAQKTAAIRWVRPISAEPRSEAASRSNSGSFASGTPHGVRGEACFGRASLLSRAHLGHRRSACDHDYCGPPRQAAPRLTRYDGPGDPSPARTALTVCGRIRSLQNRRRALPGKSACEMRPGQPRTLVQWRSAGAHSAPRFRTPETLYSARRLADLVRSKLSA